MKFNNHSAHAVACSVAVILMQITVITSDASSLSQFSSHVTVNTPARSYSHGVGDPISTIRNRNRGHYNQNSRDFRRLRLTATPSPYKHHNGYPKTKPSIPFYYEEIPHENALNAPWYHNNFLETPIRILPPSPYKVDSPDPESLWPEGLFIPPLRPYRFGGQQAIGRRSGSDTGEVLSDNDMDPYLLEGTEAVAAVERADKNGLLYFHLIPHIESLLANQESRVMNKLKPHRIGSIRHTWPYNRP